MTVTAPVLHGRESLGMLQAEIVPALAADLEDVPVLVLDHVPEYQDAPYVTWDRGWTAERDTLTGTAERVWFQISVWSTYRGWAEAIAIAERITERLSHALVLAGGWNQVHLLREQTQQLRDPDGRHRHVAMTFNCPYVSPFTGG